MTNPVTANSPPSSLRGVGWFRYLVAAISFGPLLVFVASQLGQYSYLCELISNFQLFILFILLPFPFLMFWFQWRRLGWVLSVATAWSLALVLWIYLPASQPPAGKQVIKVMSFNVLALNPNHAQVLKVIKDSDPDVVMIVEYSKPWIPAMKLLKELYPYSIESPRWHGFGIAFYSKLPIVEEEILQLAKTKTDSPALIAHVQVGDQKLRVMGIHVLSPVNRERMKMRNEQLIEISDYLSQSDEPTILLGDFNCSAWSSHIKRLLKTAKLSDSRQGFGYLASWNSSKWPLQIPIDHAFTSKHIRVHDRSVGSDSGGSDHFPIFCEVSITPAK
jgi:endonuclease/exonuclease/phosphatase (EEP) superfamily protein YafD